MRGSGSGLGLDRRKNYGDGGFVLGVIASVADICCLEKRGEEIFVSLGWLVTIAVFLIFERPGRGDPSGAFFLGQSLGPKAMRAAKITREAVNITMVLAKSLIKADAGDGRNTTSKSAGEKSGVVAYESKKLAIVCQPHFT